MSKIGSKELIRDINHHLVLETIIAKAPISRADLSKQLGLTKATISSIVQDLIEQKLVIEIGSADTSIGRKPTMLTLNAEAGYGVCIDLDVGQINFMLADLYGKKIYALSRAYEPENVGEILPLIHAMLEDCKSIYNKSVYKIIGITLGIHGIVNENQIIFTPYYDLSSIDFVQELSSVYQAPVYMLNESNLAVLGENVFLHRVADIAAIGVHTGVGLGLICNHKLYTGYRGYAGEFGHTIIALDGRPCPCGNRGCLEQYASERALLKELADFKKKDTVTFAEYADWYRQKDADAVKITESFIKVMTAGINNLLNLFNPQIILINSAFTTTFPSTLEEIKHRLVSKANFTGDVRLSAMNDTAILYGAAYVNILHFLKINSFQPKIEEFEQNF